MGDHITSHNQSGGITAKNVSVHASAPPSDSTPNASPQRTTLMTAVRWLVGAAGILASLVGIADYFGFAPWK